MAELANKSVGYKLARKHTNLLMIFNVRPTTEAPLAMHFRVKNHLCRGFIASYTIELAVVVTLYGLYFSAAISIARRLDQFSHVPWPVVVLSPVALCFILSVFWYAFRRCRGVPRSELSIAANAHLLLLGFTLLAAIGATYLWLCSPSSA